MESYKIVRMYFKGRKRTIQTGLNLKQVQEHCQDPETSSSSCNNAVGKHRTKMLGPWFDGYTKE